MIKIATKNVDKNHYTGHFTFWEYAKKKYNVSRPENYCVIFNTWTDVPESFSCTSFNTLEETMDEVKFINEMYCNTPKPQKVYSKDGKHKSKNRYSSLGYDWDYSDGRKNWGYVVLDMINSKFIKIMNGLNNNINTMSNKPTLEDYDIFFRGEDEIPVDYAWDYHEYEGWLQFRWGDGKNALDYVEPKKERPGHDEYVEIWDESKQIYIRQKVRVVDVPWDAPLPKKEKGIYYRRPNKEPVKFPGDFGYEEDYSMWPWSLEEEINHSEYENEMIEEKFADLLDKETKKKLIEQYGW